MSRDRHVGCLACQKTPIRKVAVGHIGAASPSARQAERNAGQLSARSSMHCLHGYPPGWWSTAAEASATPRLARSCDKPDSRILISYRQESHHLEIIPTDG